MLQCFGSPRSQPRTARIVSSRPVPKEIADQIVDRPDGVPLFVEELTKTVLESGMITDAGEQYVVTRPVAPLAIPTTLHASLLARLDRLAPAREVAQIGATLGRSGRGDIDRSLAGCAESGLNLERSHRRDGANLDDAMAGQWVEPGCLGV
jgi:hypothetical protein